MRSTRNLREEAVSGSPRYRRATRNVVRCARCDQTRFEIPAAHRLTALRGTAKQEVVVKPSSRDGLSWEPAV